jgi:hypothetical protein
LNEEADVQTASGTTQMCVLYDQADGRIVHIHSETFAQGMRLHSEDKMEQMARARAQGAKRDVGACKAAHLRDPQFAGWPRRVDPRTGELEIALPQSFGQRPRRS